jgi:hexulose-6-phosphate isomerase
LQQYVLTAIAGGAFAGFGFDFAGGLKAGQHGMAYTMAKAALRSSIRIYLKAKGQIVVDAPDEEIYELLRLESPDLAEQAWRLECENPISDAEVASFVGRVQAFYEDGLGIKQMSPVYRKMNRDRDWGRMFEMSKQSAERLSPEQPLREAESARSTASEEPPMDRRRFVKSGAALAATAALGPDVAVARPRRKIKKALKLDMVHEGTTLSEKFALARAAGFEGIELGSPTALDKDAVLRARDSSGLVIHGVVDSEHWKYPLSHESRPIRDRARAALETAIVECRHFGGDTVLLVPGIVDALNAYDRVYARSQEEIAKVLPMAAELKIKIAVENVWNHFLVSPLEAAAYVDAFKSAWVGWYMDVGNVVNLGWPEQWIRILGHRIVKVDVKEFSRKKRDDEGLWKGFQVEIGEGDCGWPAVMAALDAIGYEGWATAEVPGGKADRLRDVAARMTRVLAS